MQRVLQETVSARFREIRQRIAEAEVRSGRAAGSVRIVGAVKGVAVGQIVEAVRAGLYDLGENRIQEHESHRHAIEHCSGVLSSVPVIRWHFIGRLQSNKAARAVKCFDVIQSVDSVELVSRLDRLAGDIERRLLVFAEVNISSEETKGGIAPNGLPRLIESIKKAGNLTLGGLMTIGPLTDDNDRIRRAYDEMLILRDGIDPQLELSMGMSNDFVLAVACGATMVRIGTALFGPRRLKEVSV